MRSTRPTGAAMVVAALGHGLALVGFLQPWVVGEFGIRQQLSGLDLARLAGAAFQQGLAGDTLALAISPVVLMLVPLAAVNALLLLVAIRAGLIAHGHRATVWLAAPIAAVSLTGLALVLLSMGDGSVLSGPGIGLLLVIAGAALALASRPLSSTLEQRRGA